MNCTLLFRTAALNGAGLVFAMVTLCLPAQVTAKDPPKASLPAVAESKQVADLGSEQAAPVVREMANWVMASRDHAGLPFVILDKQHAKLFVFRPNGKLRGASAALLGSAKGDDSVPGIGERQMSAIRPHERTTPAGRFESSPGVNLSGEDIVWVDYEAAVSMHRVRANNKKERRLERLASETPDDNRISFGCINLPATFYDTVLKPALGTSPGVVYVLPETRTLQAVFGAKAPASRPLSTNGVALRGGDAQPGMQ